MKAVEREVLMKVGDSTNVERTSILAVADTLCYTFSNPDTYFHGGSLIAEPLINPEYILFPD